jgi:hypothetical protein
MKPIGRLLAVILLLPGLGVAKDTRIKTTRDEPLKITWIVPQKPPVKMIRRGIIRTAWRCFPAAYQDFGLSTKGLTLNIEVDGLSHYDSAVSFAVDGERTDLSGVSWVTPAIMFGGTGLIAKTAIRNQGLLIERIAAAHEVWMVTGAPGEESKVKLSSEQLAVFAEMMERYHALAGDPVEP